MWSCSYALKVAFWRDAVACWSILLEARARISADELEGLMKLKRLVIVLRQKRQAGTYDRTTGSSQFRPGIALYAATTALLHSLPCYFTMLSSPSIHLESAASGSVSCAQKKAFRAELGSSDRGRRLARLADECIKERRHSVSAASWKLYLCSPDPRRLSAKGPLA